MASVIVSIQISLFIWNIKISSKSVPNVQSCDFYFVFGQKPTCPDRLFFTKLGSTPASILFLFIFPHLSIMASTNPLDEGDPSQYHFCGGHQPGCINYQNNIVISIINGFIIELRLREASSTKQTQVFLESEHCQVMMMEILTMSLTLPGVSQTTLTGRILVPVKLMPKQSLRQSSLLHLMCPPLLPINVTVVTAFSSSHNYQCSYSWSNHQCFTWSCYHRWSQ